MRLLLQLLPLLAVAENATNQPTSFASVPPSSHGAQSKAAGSGLKVRRSVTILHISDTHSLHRNTGDLPSADILIHSGDVARVGSDAELRDFNDWLGGLKDKFQHIIVVPGNHDFWDTNWRLAQGGLPDGDAEDPAYFQSKVTNAKVLNHDLVEVMGLKIWGAGWRPRRGDSSPDNDYVDLPPEVDIVVTHEAPFGIFDLTGGGHWGSSGALLDAIYRAKPKVHLSGHIHEQRGYWSKTAAGAFEGGSQYRPNPDSTEVFRPNVPPPADYPIELESNNAMANQPVVDHSFTGVWAPQHIVGRPRLITAMRQDDAWHFSLEAP